MRSFVPFRLPDNLLLGCATSATQIEGGDDNNSWYDWATVSGRITDGSSPFRANEHWQRMEEDIALMADMGIECYRMGIEWSRIEPSEGHFDEDAIAHYRSELSLLLQNNIRPLVTLHHFSNPIWFEQMGAFETSVCIPIFQRYVAFVVERLKDLCSEYVTINEPNVYAAFGYLFGTWPPGLKNPFKVFSVMKNMAICHIHAYQDIHRIYGDQPVMVGFANHLRAFEPLTGSPIDRLAARIYHHLFQEAVTRAFLTGRLVLPLGSGAPLGEGRYYDYIGINYYTRASVHGFKQFTKPGVPTSDLGWEIHPEGLGAFCKEQYARYQAPVWITENGTCVNDDQKRILYISDHLRSIADSGVPVERYYYWTFMDNFEWTGGESAPFGLVECDFATQKRTIRRSGQFFSDVIKNRKVTQEMIE